MTALIPVLLFGTKYLLDSRTLHKVQIENGDDENIEYEYEKVSAKEAAKAVAENWNPGLTFSQQKDAAYKVADSIQQCRSKSPFELYKACNKRNRCKTMEEI